MIDIGRLMPDIAKITEESLSYKPSVSLQVI